MTDAALRITTVWMAAYAIVIFMLFAAAMIRASRWRKKDALSAELQPQIREAIVDYLAGNEELDRIREFHRSSPQAVSAGMLAFQNNVAGSARDRLCGLALELELVESWRGDLQSRDWMRRHTAVVALSFVSAYEPCRRAAVGVLEGALEDRDREMSITAAQSLARFEDSRTAARVFEMATRETLLGRILLAGPLRPHAQELCRTAVAAAFEAPETERVLAALEIVAAWERALPLPGLEKLLVHNDRAVRLQALRVVSLSLPTAEVETAVVKCLEDDDAEIASAAAAAAGRLRLHSTMALLEKRTHSGDPTLASTAAAIAALEPQARRTGAA